MALHYSKSHLQDHLANHSLAGWLIYDYGNRNPVAATLLGLEGSPSLPTSGRLFMWIPRGDDQPHILTHAMEAEQFPKGDYVIDSYSSWQEMQAWLKTNLPSSGTIAMEYTEQGMLPGLSQVDAGTIELIHSLGLTVVSSADLFQAACSIWDKAALTSHNEATRHLYEIKDKVFSFIRSSLDSNTTITEYDVRLLIESEYATRGLVTEGEPIVAVEANTRFPHYFPAKDTSLQIKNDQWLLLDIWAKQDKPGAVFSDITWMGYMGTKVPDLQKKIFEITRSARDLCIATAQAYWKQGRDIQGWELDRVTRDLISTAGYGDRFIHTTGHNLGTSVHGLGAGLNDLSARDTRRILPGTAFTIEPGIYLKDFGVRLELDMYFDPIHGPIVTTPAQTEIVLV